MTDFSTTDLLALCDVCGNHVKAGVARKISRANARSIVLNSLSTPLPSILDPHLRPFLHVTICQLIAIILCSLLFYLHVSKMKGKAACHRHQVKPYRLYVQFVVIFKGMLLLVNKGVILLGILQPPKELLARKKGKRGVCRAGQ